MTLTPEEIAEKIENLRRDIWGCGGATEPIHKVADILADLNSLIRQHIEREGE